MEDLDRSQVYIEEPVTTSYKGIDVYKLTTWVQGPVLLQALNILENADLPGMGYNSAQYIHTLYQAINRLLPIVIFITAMTTELHGERSTYSLGNFLINSRQGFQSQQKPSVISCTDLVIEHHMLGYSVEITPEPLYWRSRVDGECAGILK